MDSKGDKLNVYYQNVRGLRTKTTTFHRNIRLNSYDVVALTETWLHDSFLDSEYFDDLDLMRMSYGAVTGIMS